jgi:alpha-beta hydrolase superfamily lysophospholipase
MEVLAVRRSESHTSGDQGPSLFRRSWVAPDPCRVFVLVHGFGEHSGRYEHVGAWFAARGCAVHAFDLRGHGRSQGVRCHLHHFTELVDDLERILARTRGEHPGAPHFVVGHSMGGLVAVTYACQRRPALAGMALSGAALSIAEGVSALRARAIRLLRRVAPRYLVESGLDPDGLSTDPDVVRAYREDPLVESRMTASMAVEFFDASRHGRACGQHIALPALVLHGADDPICSPRASEAFARTVPHAQLRIYPHMRHEIFNEPGYESVLRDVLAWAQESQARSGGPKT